MEVVRMRLTDIKPAKYNPRKDLREGDPEFENFVPVSSDGRLWNLLW